MFIGGVAYVSWYKKNVLVKVCAFDISSVHHYSNLVSQIEQAFQPGYDPALDLASHGKTGESTIPENAERDTDGPWTKHLRRKEQDHLDRIIHGLEIGHYYMLLGPKVDPETLTFSEVKCSLSLDQGTGKTTMIFDAMHACQAEGVAICDAHPDLEVFRLRLGKALNYEYNEDTQTGLFQRRDPREGQHLLPIPQFIYSNTYWV